MCIYTLLYQTFVGLPLATNGLKRVVTYTLRIRYIFLLRRVILGWFCYGLINPRMVW
jgi:hypothetical protein